MQMFFGARGMLGVEMTAYGALRPLHSGHYGNWVANPAVALAHLIAELRDEHGRILIPGFYDDVRALTDDERAALAALPEVETDLQRELGIARPESDLRLADRLMAPALNVRGLAAGNVGADAENAIPTQARLSIDFRLVPGQTERRVRERVEDFLRAQGWWIVRDEPRSDERLAHPKIMRVTWAAGYSGERTDMTLPVSRAIAATLDRTREQPVIKIPMLGGSVPMSLFADHTGRPVLGVPIVNHDNNQHGSNENLRLQNLWDGIEVYAALFTDLDW
jgi:acetylornithine deacetylase/succinyl-diaminopimelate desuccinylase-like protein